MTIIYGFSRSDIDLLHKSPDFITLQTNNCVVNQIDKMYLEFINDITLEKNQFIENKSYELERLQEKINKLHEEFDNLNKSKDLDLEQIKEQKNKFLQFIGFFKKWYLEQYLWPNKFKKINAIIENTEKELFDFKKNPEIIFINRQKTLLNKIKILEELKSDILYKKAKMEIETLDELSKFNSEVIVLCGVTINDKKISQIKKLKLKSLKIDFVVVCNKGIFLINVNTDDVDLNKKGNTEFKKIEVAKEIIEIFLKFKLNSKNIAITDSRIIGIIIEKSKIFYNEELPIKILNLENLNCEINNHQDCLFKKEVSDIAYLLNNYTIQK
ncbi:MAG: hypothetical protein WCX82_04020 [archaeon]|jgi:hypothetical protein